MKNNGCNSTPCKILRLTTSGKLISADAFEQLFARHCCPWADIDFCHPQKWLEENLGIDESLSTLQQVEHNFNSATQGYHFISPGHQAFHLLPLICLLRKKQPLRVLFIAHAPAQHVTELSLVVDLLQPGDVVVCPSNNARDIICAMSRKLCSYCVVIPHFISRISKQVPAKKLQTVSSPKRRLVTLGRLTENKLIHRQIDAVALLKEQGYDNLTLEIAGPCYDKNGEQTAYVNELQARIVRLGLQHTVFFKGVLTTEAEKCAFWHMADVAIQLSKAEEESFSKSCAEAINMNVPVVATHWNGIPETVGLCGQLVPVFQLQDRYLYDIDPQQCAQAIIALLENPPTSKDFLYQQKVFNPEDRARDYQQLHYITEKQEEKHQPPQHFTRDFFELNPAVRAFPITKRLHMYLATMNIQSEPDETEDELLDKARQWEILSDLTFQSGRVRFKKILAHQNDYCTAVKVVEIAETRPLHHDEFIDLLLRDALKECDPWAREVTLNQLSTKQSHTAKQILHILRTNNGSPGSVFNATINRFLTKGDSESLTQYILQFLNNRPLTEYDGDILAYCLELCKKAAAIEIMSLPLSTWLARFPDAPGSSRLWPALAHIHIIEEGDAEKGRQALSHTQKVTPQYNTSSLETALLTLQLT